MKKVLMFSMVLLAVSTMAAAQGGDNCASPPTTIASVPFSDNTGDTCGDTNDVSDYNNGAPCNSVVNGYPGPDLIYQIQVGTGNDLTFTLTPAAADLAIFIVGDCANPAVSCVGFQDSIGGGAVSQVAFGPNGLAPGDYFVYIDSYYAGGGLSCGNFTLDVTGTQPVELIEFGVD